MLAAPRLVKSCPYWLTLSKGISSSSLSELEPAQGRLPVTGPPHPKGVGRRAFHHFVPHHLGHPLPVVPVPKLEGDEVLRFRHQPQVDPARPLGAGNHPDPQLSPTGHTGAEPVRRV